MGGQNIIPEHEREMGFVSDCERPGEKQRGETGNERQEDEEEGKKGREREQSLPGSLGPKQTKRDN